MNRLSLKVKLTMLYTFFMILVTCAALAILFSLSSREVLSSTRAKLERQVQNSTDDVGLRDGVPAVNRDFYSVEDNVYLSLYDETGYFLLGRNPYGFDSRPEIRDGQVEIIRDGDTSWYVYDMSFRLSRETTVFIRGVTSVTAAEESYRVTLRLALILLPAMVLATAFIGYRFTRRTLLPVRRITATVQKIRADADLSRRVGVPESGGKNRDEICQLAETFDQMLAQLEEAFQREKQFTSDVSHELRTPVSVILAQCGECLSDEAFTEDQKNQVRLIERKAREMSGMIGQLLFLSRADQGRQPLQKEELDLSELTQVITEEQQMVAAETDPEIEICREITPGIRACVDETLYIRLLENLLSNAVAYRKPEGKCRICVTLTASEQEIICQVEDNGIGIRPEDQERIWERFYRADPSRTEGNHSGLGLSMARWIAQAHGGEIRVESRFGEGSRFLVMLPR